MNVLSFPGGGNFCYVEALVAAALEPRTVARVQAFAGTSGGAGVALGLAAGIKPARICELFYTRAADIFPGRWWRHKLRAVINPRYPDEPLNDALRGVFGTMRCEELARPAIVCTHDLTHGVPRTVWTPANPDLLVWELARESMAAHTYFRSYNNQRDGGFFDNDPCHAAIIELLATHTARLSSIRMFSVGNGRNPVIRKPRDYREPATAFGVLAELIHDTLDGKSVVAQRRAAKVLLDTCGGRFEWFEFPDTLMDMDDPQVVEMIRARWMDDVRLCAHAVDQFFNGGL